MYAKYMPFTMLQPYNSMQCLPHIYIHTTTGYATCVLHMQNNAYVRLGMSFTKTAIRILYVSVCMIFIS